MRRIKIPLQDFTLKMQGGLMREGGCICGTLWYICHLWLKGRGHILNLRLHLPVKSKTRAKQRTQVVGISGSWYIW